MGPGSVLPCDLAMHVTVARPSWRWIGLAPAWRPLDAGDPPFMVTADEIAGVAIFASLGPAERERLSRVAADISLAPGEYAAHEGDERALFAVLEGRIEAVKVVDGIERVVGERDPGDIFGEVPIALGTVFPVAFRAAEPSRVMRVEAHDYHAVAAVAPDVGKEVGGLAAHRMAVRAGCRGSRPTRRRRARSSSGLAGTRRARSLRRFLDRNQITFRWLTPDAPDAAEQWGGPLPADGRLPGDPRRRREDRGAAAAAPGRRAAGPRHPAPRPRSTTP